MTKETNRCVFGQGDEQEEYDEGWGHPLLRQHEDDDYDLERDTFLYRLSMMQRNLRIIEQIRSTTSTGDYIFPIEDGKYRREYLHLDDQFVMGHKKAIQAAWEDVVMPDGKIDPYSRTMASDTIYYIDLDFNKTKD